MSTHLRTVVRLSIVHGENGHRGVLATSPVATRVFDLGRGLPPQKQDVAANLARENKRRWRNATGGVIMVVHPVSGSVYARTTIGGNVATIVSIENSCSLAYVMFDVVVLSHGCNIH